MRQKTLAMKMLGTNVCKETNVGMETNVGKTKNVGDKNNWDETKILELLSHSKMEKKCLEGDKNVWR